jgi:hypothetical protein
MWLEINTCGDAICRINMSTVTLLFNSYLYGRCDRDKNVTGASCSGGGFGLRARLKSLARSIAALKNNSELISGDGSLRGIPHALLLNLPPIVPTPNLKNNNPIKKKKMEEKVIN